MFYRSSGDLAWLIDAKYFARYLKTERYSLPAQCLLKDFRIHKLKASDDIQEKLDVFVSVVYYDTPNPDRCLGVNDRKIIQNFT